MYRLKSNTTHFTNSLRIRNLKLFKQQALSSKAFTIRYSSTKLTMMLWIDDGLKLHTTKHIRRSNNISQPLCSTNSFRLLKLALVKVCSIYLHVCFSNWLDIFKKFLLISLDAKEVIFSHATNNSSTSTTCIVNSFYYPRYWFHSMLALRK